jgi:hypothetical protein
LIDIFIYICFEMRKIVLITYLLTLLLAGGNEMHANVSKITTDSVLKWIITPNHQEQFTSLNRTYLLIEYADFDLDEEFFSCNDLRVNKVLQVKHTFFDKLYLSNDYCLKIILYNNPFFITKPINGQSTPIYITQSVLRI